DLQRPGFCGVCHDQHKTVRQWQASAWPAQGIGCIDCHMPHRNGDPNQGRDHACRGGHDLELVRSAVESPLRQLAANAGREGALIVEHVKNSEGSIGYDVAKDDYVDLIAQGVVDPTKVTRSALQNAASIAGLLLTTECVVTDLPEEDAPEPHGHDHGGGGMGF
ncbi:MAG: TCP-1/cpn60 chaperonin family protein, partial [Roseibacillus sp.]|nr:TCP-1/cpn60 chaperonin family protein [Roseibacillus sp.]